MVKQTSTRTLVYWERSGSLGRRLLSAKNADARAFADAVSCALKRTEENARALFTDDDVVVAWRVVQAPRRPSPLPEN